MKAYYCMIYSIKISLFIRHIIEYNITRIIQS